MTLRLRSLILAILFSLGSVWTAEARTYRCDALFQPTVMDVLEQIDRDNLHFLLGDKTLEEHTQNLSWMRKRKIRKLLQEIEVRSFPSEKALERYTIELSAALFGTSTSLSRWIKKSADERLEDSTILIIKEQLLTQGMLRTWGDVQNPQQISMLRKIVDKIWTFQKSRIAQLMSFPFRLPQLRNSEISNELMFKIIRDGFDAHAEEVRVALRHQNKVDAYNTFRKVYAPAFFAILFSFNVVSAYEQRQKQIEETTQQVVTELREQREYIGTAVPKIKKEEFDKAYAASIAEFVEKYGEQPTPEEAAIIKAKIEKALKMN